MKKLTTGIKKILNGFAFADVGEHLTARQKYKALATTPKVAVAEPAAPVVQIRPQVALYLGSEISAEIIQYTEQTCARLQHGLTVLTLQSEESARAQLAPYMDPLNAAGIELRLVCMKGDPLNVLADTLRRRPEVAFLICSEDGYFGHNLLNRANRAGGMPIPVVLVASSDSAASLAQPEPVKHVRAA